MTQMMMISISGAKPRRQAAMRTPCSVGAAGVVGRCQNANHPSVAMASGSASASSARLVLVQGMLTPSAISIAGTFIGGALIGLGNCRESYELPPGLTLRPVPCTAGTPGLAIRLSQDGLPLLQVLNMRRLAIELGLPFDPIPLPMPGDNPAVYGSAGSKPR